MARNLYDDALEDLDEDQAPTLSPLAQAVRANLAEDRQDQDRTLQASVQAGAGTSPDRAADVARLAERLGAPAPFVDRNYDTIKKRLDAEDTVARLRHTSALARMMEDPAFAAAAQDDVAPLQAIEHTLTFGASILLGVDNAQSMTGGLLEWAGEATGAEGLTAYGRGVREHNTAQAAALGTRTAFLSLKGPWDLAQWLKEGIGEQIPIMGPIAAGGATGFAIGSVVPGVGNTLGGIIGALIPALGLGIGEVQGTIKAIDPTASAPLAVFVGGSAIAAFDTILPVKIGGRLVATFGRKTAEQIARRALLAPVAPKFLRAVAGSTAGGMSIEGLTEALQEAIGAVAAAAGTGTDLPPDLWRQMVEAGATGAAVGGVAAGVTTSATHRRDTLRAMAAEQNGLVFESLAKGVLDSKLLARAPAQVQAFIAHATKDGPLETVYVPIQDWIQYWQEQQIDPAAVTAEVTGSGTAFADATATGGDLAIPTAAYAVKVAGTKHHAGLADVLRVGGPDVMNRRESVAFQAEVAAQQDAAPPPLTPAQQVRADVTAKLIAGGVPARVAHTYAAVYEGAFGSLVTRAELDPLAIYQQYGLAIQRPDVAEAVKAQAAVPAQGAALAPPGAPIAPVPGSPPLAPPVTPLAAAWTPPAEFAPVEDPRQVAVAAPGGVERRDTRNAPPTGFMANYGAAAAQMLQENPNIMADAEALRARALAARPAPPPRDTVDSAAAAGDTPEDINGAPPLTRQDVSDRGAEPVAPRRGGRPARRRPVASADRGALDRLPESTREPFADLLADARVQGFQGADDTLAARFLDKWAEAQAVADEMNDLAADGGWRDLLTEISKAGGINLDTERGGGFIGELEVMFEGLQGRATGRTRKRKLRLKARALTSKATPPPLRTVGIAGAPGVFRVGKNQGGLSVDGMREHLAQDPRWERYVNGDLGEFLTDLEDAVSKGHLENSGGDPDSAGTMSVWSALEGALQVKPGLPWWIERGDANLTAPDDILEDDAAGGPNLDDSSFNVEEFNQAAPTAVYVFTQPDFEGGPGIPLYNVDVGFGPTTVSAETLTEMGIAIPPMGPPLAKPGESQPRLPGDVGAVREGETATPEFEVPFALTSEVSQRKAKQTELFQPAYHGSGAQFETFSLHAIGSGEGAQAYGWGLYFSSKRAVADGYRERLAGKRIDKRLATRRNGETRGVFEQGGFYTRMIADREDRTLSADARAAAGRMAQGLTELHGRVHYAPASVESLAAIREHLVVSIRNMKQEADAGRTMTGDAGRDARDRDNYEAALEVLDRYSDEFFIEPPSTPGRTFTVEIPENDDYLNWDVPASQQSPKVKAALAALGIEWSPFKTKSLGQMSQWLNGTTAAAYAREDIGMRESLAEAVRFLLAEDEVGLTRWQRQHQGFFNQGAVDPLGETLYEGLRTRLSNTRKGQGLDPHISWLEGPRLASAALASHGIAGIRYLDGFSRSAGEGSQNFVLFDDKLIEVTEYDQTEEALTTPTVQAWADARKAHYGPDLVALDLYVTSGGDLHLDTIAVSRGAQRAGLGTQVMQDLTRFADTHGIRITLSPAERGYSPGGDGADAAVTTSAGRLERFYRRFGFVPNAGRHKDFTTRDTMLREPTVRVSELFQEDRGRVAPRGYQQDLFGNPLPGSRPLDGGPAARDAGDVDPAAALQRDDVAGNFWTRTQLISTRIRQLGASVVTTPDQAAQALAYLAQGAQERADVLVTDAAGAPLAIVGSFKGGVNATGVFISTIVNEAFRIQGAASAWFAHNHPSGSSTLSPEDRILGARLAEAFRGSEIALRGVLAIGSGTEGAREFTFLDPSLDETRSGVVAAADSGVSIPVVEREFTATEKLGERIGTTDDAVARVPVLAGGQFGVVLLDTKGAPIGFAPFDPAKSEQLRTDGRLDAFYRALSVSAPGSAMINHTGPETIKAAVNLASALQSLEIQVLDLVGPNAAGKIVSQTATLGFAPPKTFYQTAPFYSALTRAAEQLPQAKGTPEQMLAIPPAMREAALQGQALFQEPAPGRRRGSLRFGADRQMTISLFERANLSTFLHETGHFYLEVFGDLFDQVAELDPATLTPSQRGLLADYGAILRALGVEDRAAITVEQHEAFARMFEAYLMTGKAPSLELRSAFADFRAWLLSVYHTLKGLNVQLTDEVTQVFDRMLATDAALADAAAQGHVAPLFTTAESAGMTPAGFELYRATVATASQTAREQLEVRILRDVQRAQEREWKDRRDEIEATVTAEVHAQPVFQALAAMQRGTRPDGSAIVEGMETEPYKLSRAILVERYGPDRLKRLPRPFIYTTDGGLDPDTVAERFGFTSGDHLLTAVEQTPPMRALIQQETAARMIAEHGAILLDGTLPAAAQAAISNEDTEIVIRAELRALGQLRRTVAPFVKAEQATAQTALGAERKERAYERRWFEAEGKLKVAIAEGRKQVEIDALQDEVNNLRAKARGGAATIRAAIPPAGALKAAARDRIGRTRIRDLRPAGFWSASRQAATRALEAAARQDFDAAIVAKQQELINLALYREATRALDDATARVRRAKDLATPAARARLGLAGEAYQDQVDGILDRYEFATIPKRVLDRRASLRKFVAGVEGEGLPVDLPEELLEETRRTNYAELTIDELVGVSDGLDALVHLARLKLRLLKGAAARELAETAATLTESIREHARRTPRPPSRDRRPGDERHRTIGDFFAGHRKLASMLRELDGFEDGGPAVTEIMFRLNEAGAREAAMHADVTAKFAVIVHRAFPGRLKRGLYVKQHIPAIGASLSRMERIAIAFNWGNEGNRDRVRRAEKWDDTQVQAILDTLTASDLQFVQDVFDLIEGYWPEIEAKQKRVFGVAPEKVDAVEIVAAAGTFRGGYYPLKYDDRLSVGAIAHLDLDAANAARQAAYAHAQTKRNHTKARVERVKLPLRRDFGVMFEHVGQVIHDLTHHEALVDIGRILGHADVQQAILDTQGDLVYKQIRNAIRDVAFGDVPATSGVEKAMNHVRMGATVAGLGWNLTTAFLQPLGLANSIVRIGPTWVGRGLARWLRSPTTMVETVRWIDEHSPMMQSRGRTFNRELHEIRNQLGLSAGPIGSWVDEVLSRTAHDLVTRQGIADSYFWMIQQMQRVADIPTWLGAYEKAMAAEEPEARAFSLADQAVLDSQGGGQIKDLSAVQRGGPMLKMWTNFMSYFLVVYNQAAESRRRTQFSHPAEVGRLASDYLMLFIVPATLGFLVREAMRPPAPDEDEADFWKRLARENLSYLAGTMLGVREMSGAIQGYYGYEGPAGARAFAGAARLGAQVQQGEADAAFWKALNESAGVLLHYPAGQVARTLGGIVALAEGRTENPAAVVAGPPRERR